MFDIGWTELLVIACVAIIVVGPKDLPRMLRTLGQTIGKMRKLSREFQSTFNDALREAEQQADIADMKKQVESAANFNPLGDLKNPSKKTRPRKPTSQKWQPANRRRRRQTAQMRTRCLLRKQPRLRPRQSRKPRR